MSASEIVTVVPGHALTGDLYAAVLCAEDAETVFRQTGIGIVYCIDVPDCFLATNAADAIAWYRRQKEKRE
jgi:hypothetical protein